MGSDFLNISDEPCFSLSAAFKFQCYSGQIITRFSANKANESTTYPDRSSKQIAVMPYKMHLNCILCFATCVHYQCHRCIIWWLWTWRKQNVLERIVYWFVTSKIVLAMRSWLIAGHFRNEKFWTKNQQRRASVA